MTNHKQVGRLKRTLKDRCPKCSHVLQLRAKEKKYMLDGVEMATEEDFIACSSCSYKTSGISKKTDKDAWRSEQRKKNKGGDKRASRRQ